MELRFGGKRDGKKGRICRWRWGGGVLGVSKMTTREVIQGELGLSKISSRRILVRLKFWYKIINMNKTRLIYKIYRQRKNELIQGGSKDKKNWCYWTWKFLKSLNLEHLWKSDKVELGCNFSKLVKKLIKMNEESEWREQLEKKSKLRLYRKLKSRLVVEDYVVELDREQRRHLTMLTESARVCNVCLSNELKCLKE